MLFIKVKDYSIHVKCIKIIFLLSCITPTVCSKSFIFEAEDSHTVGSLNIGNNDLGGVSRSEASGRKAVHMYQGHYLEYTFCVHRETNVKISNIRFSNDGPHDEYLVEIDGNIVGEYKTGTQTGTGNAWNNYHSSGLVGTGVILAAGNHKIKLLVAVSDQWGAEVDFILVDVDDQKLDELGFHCDMFCFDDITFKKVKKLDSVPGSRFDQKSFRSSCSEEANVKVAVYNDFATLFRLTASNPKYKTFSNNRLPNYSGCNVGRPTLNFSNIAVDPYEQSISTNKFKIDFAGSPNYVIMAVTFFQPKLSLTRDPNEHRVGSVLTIKFKDEGAPFDLDISYLGESRRYISFDRLKVDPKNKTIHTWKIPDHSWSLTQENIVRLGFSSSQAVNTFIESITLKKRETVHNKTVLYQDNKYIIEGTDIDSGYMEEHTMATKSKYTKEVYNNLDLIQVYAKLPWSSGFSQVFSLYHDGTASLLPITPHGLDWIPFGTTVVIGPNNASDPRPTSPIKNVELDPINMIFEVEFVHGDRASLSVDAMDFETVLTVKYGEIKHNRKIYPLMTVLSTWISDGYSLTDQISVNGDTPRKIMGNWKTLYGTSAMFYRKCISSYHTMSPDLRLEVIDADELVI
ncbi:uncharacterized protein LOC133199636 [Saccostrea echinata]|uniref:uncharacterized protein LOC133199636 n=1 Tax=Saccostrea echinata TaxID=191078 RepID=UPI002A7F8773|nr:uncharacterized protein LOC133199636 [Saccostrea echinata]